MIDIIIPIYNANKYLDTLISSIIKQTYKDYKIYLIDSNSTEIYNLNKYKNININYIKLTKQLPPGLTRQVGLEKSNSKYVMFIDQDDELIGDNALEILVSNIKDYDIVECGEYYEKINKNMINSISLHSKLYKREFINNKNIKFNDYKYHEDLYFNNLCYINNAKINTIEKVIYFYHNNPNSIINTTEQIEIIKLEYIFKTIKDIKKVINNNNIKYYKELLFNNYDYFLKLYPELSEKEKEMFIQYINKYDKENKDLMTSKSNIELKEKINNKYNKGELQ